MKGSLPGLQVRTWGLGRKFLPGRRVVIVVRLPEYPREERRTVKTGQGDVYVDSRHIHTDEKARWSWFLDLGTGDVSVNTDLHGGYDNYEQLRREFPFPEDSYLP